MGLLLFIPFTVSKKLHRFETMKKIVIKEIDQFISSTTNKRISEYLIYVMIGEVKIEAYSELGAKNKKERVNELLVTHFNEYQTINKEETIEEMAFDELTPIM